MIALILILGLAYSVGPKSQKEQKQAYCQRHKLAERCKK